MPAFSKVLAVGVVLAPFADAVAIRGAATGSVIDGCGALASYPNAKPKNFEDTKKERYDVDLKKKVPVVFKAGDKVPFECKPGFTTDGSKDGDKVFDVECSEQGYYKPAGVCIEASKCGAVPEYKNALPTGNKVGEAMEMTCSQGFSLDGEKVVAGGMAKNQVFTLKCIEFSGDYEKFEGECKAAGHIPATEAARLYNKVFEALFIVSCKGTLKKDFAKGKGPGLEDTCGHIKDGGLSGECATLVTKIEADFTSEQAARKDFDKGAKKEWHEAKDDPDRPGIVDEAKEFCTSLWKILELKPPAM